MVSHPWPTFSPEANYTALASGSGPTSTLAYSETLSAEAANLQTVMAASTATGAATYGTSWQGLGAAASSATQTAMDAQHELLAAALLEKVPHVGGDMLGEQPRRMEALMGTVLDALSPEHRAVIVEELSHRDPTLLAGLRDATEPTLEQREGVNRVLADAVVWSLGPDYTPNDHGLAVERAVKAFLEVWPICRRN